MKKLTIICTILLSSFFSTAYAKEKPMPTQEKWNIGIECSDLNPIKIFKKYKNLCDISYHNFIDSILALHPGIFGKYQFNPYVNCSIKFNILEDVIKNFQNKAISAYTSNITYVTSMMYPIKKNIHLYAQAGAQLRAQIKDKNLLDFLMINKYQTITPFCSVGLKYFFNNYLNFNFNINLDECMNNAKFENIYDIFSKVSLGLSWPIGSSINMQLNSYSLNNGTNVFLHKPINIENEINIQHPYLFFLNLSQDFLSMYKSLGYLRNKIKKSGKERVIVVITGYNDKIEQNEKDGPKKCLNRALEVSKYFIKQGFLKKNIVIQGFKRLW